MKTIKDSYPGKQGGGGIRYSSGLVIQVSRKSS